MLRFSFGIPLPQPIRHFCQILIPSSRRCFRKRPCKECLSRSNVGATDTCECLEWQRGRFGPARGMRNLLLTDLWRAVTAVCRSRVCLCRNCLPPLPAILGPLGRSTSTPRPSWRCMQCTGPIACSVTILWPSKAKQLCLSPGDIVMKMHGRTRQGPKSILFQFLYGFLGNLECYEFERRNL